MKFLTVFFFLQFIFFPGATRAAAESQDPWTEGSVAERQKRYEDALADFREVPDSDPHRTAAWREMGSCEAWLGRYQDALDAYSHYLALAPGDVQISAYVDKLRQSQKAAEVGNASSESETAQTFGLRLGVAYGWGISTYTFGSPVNQYGGYSQQQPTGFAWSAEGLYSPAPWFELGLGYFPLSVNMVGASSNSGLGVTSSDSSTFVQNVSPVLLTLYGRHSFFDPQFHAVIGAGLGFSPGSSSDDEGDQNWSNGFTPWEWKTSYQDTFSSGVAYRGVFGGEYDVNPWCSVFLFWQLLGAHYVKTQQIYKHIENVDGSTVYDVEVTTNYQASPTKYSYVNPVVSTTVSGSTSTTLTTYNDGAVQYTQKTVTVGGVQTYYQHIETDTNAAGANSILQESFTAGITLRY
jgi:tetratricopeptide (TPR) repeat protein